MGNPNANLCGKPSAGFSKMRNSLARPQSRYKFARRGNTVEQIKCHRPRPPQFLIMFFFIFLWRAELENNFLKHWHRFCAQLRIIVMQNSNRSLEEKSDAKYRRNWEKKLGFLFMINIPGGLPSVPGLEQ